MALGWFIYSTNMTHKSTWPKPGLRLEPGLYERLRAYAKRQHLSLNDVVNLLLRRALEEVTES